MEESKTQLTVGTLLVALSLLAGLGGVVAYSESKFAPKESTERDITEIKTEIHEVYNWMLQHK